MTKKGRQIFLKKK